MRRNVVALVLVAATAPAYGQVVESTGARALGMGGAFVAVADDSSATWWNPAGLAPGPFVDASISRHATAVGRPSAHDPALSFALVTPAVGVALHRVRVTQVASSGPIAGAPGRREEPVTGIVTRSIDASALGVTLVQTLGPGIHAGGTLKWVRGTADPAGTAPIDRTGAQHRFDADVGVMASAGALRVGAAVRNLRAAAFDGPLRPGDTPLDARVRLPRHVRAGVAFAPDAGRVWLVAVDADLRRYLAAGGHRRAVAVGVERWWWRRRLAVRGGGRFNQVGRRERSATAGVSLAVRPGAFLEGHVLRGGTADERGWGVGARMTF